MLSKQLTLTIKLYRIWLSFSLTIMSFTMINIFTEHVVSVETFRGTFYVTEISPSLLHIDYTLRTCEASNVRTDLMLGRKLNDFLI